MLKTKPVTSNFVNPIKLNQRLNKSLVLSSRQMDWKGILVEPVGATRIPRNLHTREE